MIASGEENMERYTSILISILVAVALSTILLLNGSSGIPTESRMAIIIVSSWNGENHFEIDKAIFFTEYLINEGFQEDDIDLISTGSSEYIDSIDLLSNINSSFSDLIFESTLNTEVVIYISDNGHAENEYPSLWFRDGNISGIQFDQWFDQIVCSELTFIIGGNRSGIIGPNVTDPERTVMSSMNEDQVSFPDLFNITRSLEDPESDTNEDGVVDFLEGFYHERDLVINYGQTPCLWTGS